MSKTDGCEVPDRSVKITEAIADYIAKSTACADDPIRYWADVMSNCIDKLATDSVQNLSHNLFLLEWTKDRYDSAVFEKEGA